VCLAQALIKRDAGGCYLDAMLSRGILIVRVVLIRRFIVAHVGT
jgi:hypothetical protein